MVTILTTVEVQAGREKDFEALWRQTRPTPDNYPGLRSERLLRDTEHHGRYVGLQEWGDHEQFNAFVRASGMVMLLDTNASWITSRSWTYLENVEWASPTS
jgi:heme-degrading monooxygenase HmoA